jgi:hypothetical protein
MPRKHIILMSLIALLAGCNSKPVSSEKASSTLNTPVPATPTPSAVSLPAATLQPADEGQKEKSLFGAMRYTVPEGWEIIATGVETAELEMTTDYLGVRNGDKQIEITLLMRCPAGIGGDPYYERFINDKSIGNYTLSGGIYENDTKLSLTDELFDNPEHGNMFVNYTNPEGASEDDPALVELLESLEVNDCFGTVTVEADEINIRDYNSTDSDIVGTARKGETYKVYSISYTNDYTGGYTWYNIGELEFIADKDGEWVEYTENK